MKKTFRIISMVLCSVMLTSFISVGVRAADATLSNLAAYLNHPSQGISKIRFAGDDASRKLIVTIHNDTTLADANKALDTCVEYIKNAPAAAGYTSVIISSNSSAPYPDSSSHSASFGADSYSLAYAVFQSVNGTGDFSQIYRTGSVTSYLNGKTIYVKFADSNPTPSFSPIYTVEFTNPDRTGGGGGCRRPTTETKINSDGSSTTTETTTINNRDGSTTKIINETTTQKDGSKAVTESKSVSKTNVVTGAVTTETSAKTTQKDASGTVTKTIAVDSKETVTKDKTTGATTTTVNTVTTITDAAGKVKTEKTSHLIVDATTAAAAANSVNLNAEAVKEASQAGITAANVTVITDIASVVFDRNAAKALAKTAGDSGTTTTLSVRTEKSSAEKLTKQQKAAIDLFDDAVILDLSVVATQKDIRTGSVISQETIRHFGESGAVTVSVPYTPRGDGSHVTVYYIDSQGKAQKADNCFYDKTKGCAVFTTTHFSTYVVAEEASAAYKDVSLGQWFYPYVNYCVEKGYMKGASADRFDPSGSASRAMLVTALYRMAGSPAVNFETPFNDVKAGDWYSNAIAWAYQQKITKGISGAEFGLNIPLNREMTVTLFYRFVRYQKHDVSVGKDTNILSYTDAESISEFAVEAFQWACGSGLIKGVDNNMLAPQGKCNRAQLTAMLARFDQNMKG